MVVNPENCSLLIVNTQSVTMIWVFFLHLHKQEREQSPKKSSLKEKNFLFSFSSFSHHFLLFSNKPYVIILYLYC